jgi:uncharacterized caspase-like protein
MRVYLLALQVFAALSFAAVSALAQVNVGQFKGEVVARFLADGRNMKLEQAYGYMDPRGQHWDVPAGTETDGASIPRILWISHPPFTGKYRAAAVVHDYYCQTKSRGWKETHEVFYHAMRAAGVDDRTAKLMYAAVYHFGPRWGQGEPRSAGPGFDLPIEDQTRVFEEMRSWIERDSPELGEIARRLDGGGGLAMARERRVALVVGNSTYKHTAKLENPKNDAADIAGRLEKLGFEVITGIDLDKSGMDQTVRSFAEKLSGASLGVFFYAGHGLQVDGQNYLVPVDARLTSASALDFEMIRLDLVQRSMERETKANVLFLDACRDNPLARNLARALGTRSTNIGRGLAAAESGEGTLIAFSTQPGAVAFDGEGRNSPFAAALLKHIATPGEDLSSVLIGVRNDVMASTSRRQVPWDHSALTARVYFGPQPKDRASGPSFEQQAELALWATVKDGSDPAVVRSYLDRYPNGTFAATARIIMEKLAREAEQNAAAALRDAELRKAEEARRAAEQAKIESERKALMAKQADELRKAQQEAQKAREALAKAEQEREVARKAAEDARVAANSAKAEREGAANTGAASRKGSGGPSAGARSGGNCFTFNNRTFCQ